MKKALITGIGGQDGSYLAELLLEHGYQVHGSVRRASTPNLGRIHDIRHRVHLHYADLTDPASVARLVTAVMPDEIYNLAAMSDVRVSFDTPVYSGVVTGVGAASVLDAAFRYCPRAKVYQAGSSEMFGTNPVVPTNEASEFQPASPYATAKVYAYYTAKNYRDAYGMFAVNGILFNHESPRRGVEFVTRKITLGVSAIARGTEGTIALGNLEARRDWGYAPEYMEAAFRMMQEDEPEDYVIATGETHSVREFAERAFSYAGLDWRNHVLFDSDLLRPVEVPYLLGDASKAKEKLGWEPTVKFGDLVELMTGADL